MKNIVITGATSMLGIATLEACLKNSNANIYAIIRPHSRNAYRIPDDERISIIECDLEQYSALGKLIFSECDIFYHFAWRGTGVNRNQDILEQVKNIQYTIEALRAASQLGCKKFIGAGSQAEFGKLNVDKIGVSSPVNPVQAYGISKYAAGKMLLEEAARLEMDCFWVRVFSVYGKYDRSKTMISTAMAGMKMGRKMAFTEGKQRWDYLYSEDAGEAFYLIGEEANGRKIYCLGSGKSRPLKDFIIDMRDIVNPNIEIGLGEIPYSKDSIMNLCADISEIQKDIGWGPTTDFRDGIRKILSFEKNEAVRCKN